MARVTKKIHYYRSVNSTGKVSSFYTPLKQALDSNVNIDETEVNFTDDIVRVQRRSHDGKNILLHLTKYSPGNKNSVITPKVRASDDNEIGHSAPAGKEFKDGECFLLINNYHVLFSSNGISHQKAELYLHLFFQREAIKFDRFSLKPASNLDKLNLLRTQGVKSVRLNVSAYKLSIPAKKNGWFRSAVRPVTDELSALIVKDRSRSEEKALEDLMVSIEIGLDGNSKAADEAKSTVLDLAAEILDDDEIGADGFTIITRDNTPVTSSEIRLSDSVRATKTDSSVNHSDIWTGMKKYFGQLRTDKLLEQ